jgi:hypothetical protein
MTVRPNISRVDLQRLQFQLEQPNLEFRVWAELWPDLMQFDNDPRCHIDGCLICNGE